MYVEYDEQGWGCYPNNEECRAIQKSRQHEDITDNTGEGEPEEFILRAGEELYFG